MINRLATHRRSLTFLLVLTMIVVGSPFSASADDFENRKYWTTVGSVGTVDEASLSTYSMSGPFVGVRNTAELPATVIVRYNVTAVDGLVVGSGHCFEGRWRDNGSGGQVIISLKKFSFITGAVATLDVLDSNTFDPSPGISGGGLCGASRAEALSTYFDFNRNAYFVEVRIIKTAANGTPAFVALKIHTTV